MVSMGNVSMKIQDSQMGILTRKAGDIVKVCKEVAGEIGRVATSVSKLADAINAEKQPKMIVTNVSTPVCPNCGRLTTSVQ